MKRLMLLFLAALPVAIASAGIRVVTTLPDIADLVRQVGGDRVTVDQIVRGDQNPHFIEVKPSYMMKLKSADLFFMIGMEERLFPHIRALDDLDGMEEERRLCYVGMTRARERLYLLNARRRYLFGQEQSNLPSRFLKDIPAELLDDGGDEAGGLRLTSTSLSTSRSANASYPPESINRLRSLSGVEGSGGPGAPTGHNLAAVAAAYDDIEVIPEPPEENDGVFIGMRVRHAKFGVGTIRKIEGSGEGQKVIVWFNSVGPKKLLLRFAGLERV